MHAWQVMPITELSSVRSSRYALVNESRLAHQMIVDADHTRDGLGGYSDRLSLRLRLRKTPEVNDAVGDGHIELVNVRPGLLLEFGDQLFPYHCIGKADFQLGASARHGLNDIGAADDADQLTGRVHD